MAESETGTTPEETKVPKEEIEARLQGKEPPEKKEPEAHKADTTFIEEKKEPEKPDAEIEAIVAQADKPDAVRNALNAERTAAREARERADDLAAKVKAFEDRDKSEQQKLEEKADADRSRADAAEAKLQRVEVAIAAKLPLELAERLQGSTKKELETDAARLLELVKPNAPTGDPDAGKGRGEDKQGDFTAQLRRDAGVVAQ